jgi:hypothetical protein
MDIDIKILEKTQEIKEIIHSLNVAFDLKKMIKEI